MFAAKLPARKFSSYECAATQQAGERAIVETLNLDEKQAVMHEEEVSEKGRA